MATVVENDYYKELSLAIKGLTLVASGRWEGTLDTLDAVLNQFRDRNKKNEFGLCSWLFDIGALRPFSPKPDHHEYMRPIVTAWIEEQEKVDYPDRPYGKVFATRIAKGWRVELWQDGMSSDPAATEGYMQRLFQALVEDGLQPVDTPVSEPVPMAEEKPYHRLPPELVAEIIGHTIMRVGYTYKKEHDTYIVIHEGGELGRIMLSTPLGYGPYFSTAMPHKTGVGEHYIPKPPQDGFQPVDGDTSHFRRLVWMIHEHIIQQIEINDIMDLWPSANVGDGDVSVASLLQQANEDPTRGNPWEDIPDHRWDRKAVQMLWEGYQDPQIAKKLDVSSKTVTNRLSFLRQLYPDCVPTRDELRKKKLNR